MEEQLSLLDAVDAVASGDDDNMEFTVRCPCGKIPQYWSALLDKAYCSDECYWSARAAIGMPYA